MTDPIIKARLGSQFEEYVKYHAEEARAWHRQEAGINPENKYNLPSEVHEEFLDNRRELHLEYGAENSDPYIIKVDDTNNCSYCYHKMDKGYAYAHLISTGGLVHMSHDHNESLVHDISCHDWTDGVRLIGIQAGDNEKLNVFTGPDAHQLLRRYWKELCEPIAEPGLLGFCRIIDFGNMPFTSYQKVGNVMDTCEPEYLVTTSKKIGKPVQFRTTVGGYHGYCKYHINEMKAIAPPAANAYRFISEVENEWHDGNPTHQTVMVQFYCAEADTSQRLIRASKLARDYDTMMKLLQKK
jgi:hypothetical protein